MPGRLTKRGLPRLILALLLFWVIFSSTNILAWHLLPGDSPAVLAVRFSATFLSTTLRTYTPRKDEWLFSTGAHPVDFERDVGIVVKTGYGTRDRVSVQSEAMGLQGNKNVLVIGDWSSGAADGRVVHDAVGSVMKLDVVADMLSNSNRFRMYQSLQTALDANEDDEALRIGKEFGWELDALKFIWGLELLGEELPDKKWYIFLDDDTFMLRPSLLQLLSHLDPSEPHYIGNPVGDWRGRFAHGGSGIVISGTALRKLLQRRDVVAEAHRKALAGEVWGDRLVATTFHRVGVYLDETFAHLFNGEPPRVTRLRPDRFCAPLMSFHGLRSSGEMREVGEAFKGIAGPVLWGHLWRIYEGPGLESLTAHPVRDGWDYTGRSDEGSKIVESVDDAECERRCSALSDWCLAWTWRDGRCHLSPWMIAGFPAQEAKTGLRADLFERMIAECPEVLRSVV